MKFDYNPTGVCSRKFHFDIEDNIIVSLQIEGGCNGNLQGISSLVKGMNIDDVINKLQGIRCGFNSTSCPDQISEALLSFKNHNQ